MTEYVIMFRMSPELSVFFCLLAGGHSTSLGATIPQHSSGMDSHWSFCPLTRVAVLSNVPRWRTEHFPLLKRFGSA
jgi:hypothetical protein